MLLGFALVLALLQVGMSFAGVPFNQYRADIMNGLEQNYFREVRINQDAPQQHRPRPMNPEATPQPVYIKDRNSGKVLQYKPNNDYQVVIEPYSSSNTNQQWYTLDSGVAGYFYIANGTQTGSSSFWTRYITASNDIQTPIYLEPLSAGLNLNQLWILRDPDAGTNQYFIIMNAKTGYVMNVRDKSTASGTPIQVYSRTNNYNEQFTFFN